VNNFHDDGDMTSMLRRQQRYSDYHAEAYELPTSHTESKLAGADKAPTYD
jgi:hypothetical protein